MKLREAPANPPVWIIGAGAIGLYMAAHLSHVTRVTLAARAARATWLAESGFQLAGAESGDFRPEVVPIDQAFAIPEEAIVVVATKATDLEKLVGVLSPNVAAGQTVALVQNGLGVHKFARSYLPTAHLVRLTCWVGVSLEQGRRAVVAGAPLFESGYDQPEVGKASEQVLALLNAANLRARHGGSVAEVEWRKALLNLSVSGICAVLDERNGAILGSPELREIVEDILAEAMPVAAAEGVVLGPQDADRVFTALDNTRDNWNAMIQDLRRGASTEMPFLNAAVDRLARRHGLRAPVNATIARLITHITRGGRRAGGGARATD
ncbi:MAG: 2-dehydropantoate 2-reductase [Candidatus Sericytochromatia bacterium]|nr:2-dehydropantoate 2-reductase [Candidatus Sericytochromatia bacterium]